MSSNSNTDNNNKKEHNDNDNDDNDDVEIPSNNDDDNNNNDNNEDHDDDCTAYENSNDDDDDFTSGRTNDCSDTMPSSVDNVKPEHHHQHHQDKDGTEIVTENGMKTGQDFASRTTKRKAKDQHAVDNIRGEIAGAASHERKQQQPNDGNRSNIEHGDNDDGVVALLRRQNRRQQHGRIVGRNGDGDPPEAMSENVNDDEEPEQLPEAEPVEAFDACVRFASSCS